MFTIAKCSPGIKRQRLTVKGFKTLDAMRTFLNAQGSNEWSPANTPDYSNHLNSDRSTLAPGVYAWAGGKWHNVKTLDASVLAHI